MSGGAVSCHPPDETDWSHRLTSQDTPHQPPVPGPPKRDLSPEARRRSPRRHREHLLDQPLAARCWIVGKRVLNGAYNDGLIHAGNLAYMSLLAIFPFFLTGAAIFSLVGEVEEQAAAVGAVLAALPPVVADVLRPVALNVIEARSGWLLWLGGLFGLWTVGSLIETIRDILRRAYGTHATRAFWQYRLLSTGIIIGAVLLLMLSLIAQVAIGAAEQVIDAWLPQLTDMLNRLAWTRIIPAVGLFGSIFLLFYTLTPAQYRRSRYPKWPGALLTTLWWVGVTIALPPALRSMFNYDLTYGSLAGSMIVLFFFWLVGLGMVAGAELNAALAEPPEDHPEDEALGFAVPEVQEYG
ncbi:YihY/virulence factor BrkB family protein [Altererythrobacter sp. KTW20L]|uniref:YihY/virulence factor BrkB family protein n=1 Tax=Altererythrobacter sp. KTW20L TaxID=2942210 RepID=UPI0020BF5B3D|nr:YihY/virulence factor BrkB family protein [Altererythrobacter sp. KTW20L]MCL6249901.1 YihY/virulence factor BrkB family protein [Altererythrobacter sp. KTW20L]